MLGLKSFYNKPLLIFALIKIIKTLSLKTKIFIINEDKLDRLTLIQALIRILFQKITYLSDIIYS